MHTANNKLYDSVQKFAVGREEKVGKKTFVSFSALLF